MNFVVGFKSRLEDENEASLQTMNLFFLRSFIFYNFHLIARCRVLSFIFFILIAGLTCQTEKWIEYEYTRIGEAATQIRNKSKEKLKPEDAVQLIVGAT